MRKGLVIVVSAPSGGGKGTILKALFERCPNLRYSVSATTRLPRPGEIDGQHYHFIGKEDFQGMIAKDQMLEYAEYCDNYYGTPKEPVEKQTEQGFDVVLEIEVQGGKQVKRLLPDSVSVFIVPPSMEILERRLRDRGTEENSVVEKRLKTAREEIPAAYEYDYIVVNDRLENAVDEFAAIIAAEKLKTIRNKDRIERMAPTC